MDFEPIILEGFEGREDALEKIERYIHPITNTMFYRSNDLIHSRRVLWHLEESIPNILEVYGGNFDTEFARTLALVHDDVEILAGDVQLYDKEQMTEHELSTLEANEKKIIPRIVSMYGETARGYDYKRLLISAKEKSGLEAQFVSFFDKFDAGGEAWHEIWAGNNCFIRPAKNYVRRLNEFLKKYLDMVKFFEEFPGYLPGQFDFEKKVKEGKLHTKSSLEEDSGYPPYERWKRTVMEREEVKVLSTQIEFNLY